MFASDYIYHRDNWGEDKWSSLYSSPCHYWFIGVWSYGSRSNLTVIREANPPGFGFFSANTDLTLDLWTVIWGISGFDDIEWRSYSLAIFFSGRLLYNFTFLAITLLKFAVSTAVQMDCLTLRSQAGLNGARKLVWNTLKAALTNLSTNIFYSLKQVTWINCGRWCNRYWVIRISL